MNGTKGKNVRRLSENDVAIGQPLKWSVITEQGQLLLSKGQIVRSEQQLRRLINQRVFIEASPDGPGAAGTTRNDEPLERKPRESSLIGIFEWVDLQYQRLDLIYSGLTEDPQPGLVSDVRYLAEILQKTLMKYPNGVLASLQLTTDRQYSKLKALHVAALCELLGKRINLRPMERLPLICAGLTHDVAMWQLQDRLQVQEAPLSDGQWQQIRRHPQEGFQLLRQIGLADKSWLGALLQHHERLDGSGYPQGLAEDKVCQQARILSICDIYAAMIRPRADRGSMMPKDALRDIFLQRGESVDGVLAQVFIKEIGIFPPGTAVRLANGEVAIVTGPGSNASFPEVETLINAAGQPLKKGVPRDTSNKTCAVAGLVPRLEHPARKQLLDQMWPKMPKRDVGGGQL